MNMFFKSFIIGMVSAIAVEILAFALAPFFDAVGVYTMPSGLLIPVIGRLIPSKVIYWLIPDGGAAAGVLLILVCTLLFWTIVFGVIFFVSATLRRGRTIGQ